jgi:Protein of unknown function (DUF2723)
MRLETRIRLILTLVVFLVSFTTYTLTSAPTVSFWDCGELIAASNILGNPHPPGNPLFTLLARAFILAAPFEDIAYRVNFIAVLSSAAMIAMVFLFTVKLLDLVFDRKLNSFIVHVAGLIAAMLVNFSDTIWFSAVEAEVYGMAMFIVMLLSWLSLYWFEHKGTLKGDRAIVMMSYLAFLGIGIHPFSIITLPVLGLFFFIGDKKMRTHFPLIITSLLLFSIVYAIGNFMWYAAAAIVLSLIGVAASQSPEYKAKWRHSFWVALVALVGFSSYLYVPIRSSVGPEIDEGQPRTYATFKEYLERKQYGSESMIRRAFHRRGQLANQLLVHPHMGYGGYMFAQYLPWKVGENRRAEDGPLIRKIGEKEFVFPTLTSIFHDKYKTQYFLFLLFQLPFLLGGYFAYKHKKELGLYILLLYGATSFGLIFYMNFADGSGLELRDYEYWKSQGFKPEAKPAPVHLEVRDRDYFFTPGYIYMGVLFGVAAAFAMRKLQALGGVAGGGGLARGFGVIALVLASVVPAWSNYKEHNRSGSLMPWDYAYNLLNSCRPNSVLFTNGDNDTFPLWYMQTVEKIRTDVRVINLSLVNTNWYIHQLKEHHNKVKVTFTPEEIDALEPQGWKFDKPVSFKIPRSNVVAQLKPRPYLRVQDILVLHVVQNNYPDRPIHFAVTVGDDNMMGLEQWVKMEGMVYTLVEEPANRAIDPVATARLVDSVYKFRNLGNPKIYVDGNTEGLLTNYSATNFRLAMWAQDQIEAIDRDIAAAKAGSDSSQAKVDSLEALRGERVAFAEKYLALNARILPREWRTHYYASQLYMATKQFDKAEASLEKGLATADDPKPFTMNLVELYLKQGKADKAETLLSNLKEQHPNDFEVWFSLAEVYQRRGEPKKGRDLIQDWLKRNPSHQYAPYAQHTVRELEKLMARPTPAPSDSAKAPADSAKAPADSAKAPVDSVQGGKDTAQNTGAASRTSG